MENVTSKYKKKVYEALKNKNKIKNLRICIFINIKGR